MHKRTTFSANKFRWLANVCIFYTALLFVKPSYVYSASLVSLTAKDFTTVLTKNGRIAATGAMYAPADNTKRFAPKASRRIRVAADRRHLEYEDGSPFFYLGDTAWELFHRLNREEADKYLENRASKGFTVIQAVALAELDGLNTPNPYGNKPLHNNNPATPNDAYFQHVDYIVNKAESLGMFIGMLPTWGDKFEKLSFGIGPVVFNPENAKIYGAWMGNRYKNKPIIWMLGGDRHLENSNHYAIIRAMAEGIRSAVGNSQLITFHPVGPAQRSTTNVDRGSSTYFHNDAWLDFNTFQSGHNAYNVTNYQWVAHDRALSPAKPTLDSEPRYEDHPVDWNPGNGWFNDYDVRQAAYWALLAGACGHTYGDHNIWQMWQPGRNSVSNARTAWQQALDHPGSRQMGYAKDLFLSRPWFDLNPDQELIADGHGSGESHVVAAKGKDYAMFYIPTGENLTVKLGKFSGNTVKGWWYNPRDKEVTPIGTFPNNGTKSFDAPGGKGRGNDWILVLDDESKNYPAPGNGSVIAGELPLRPDAPANSVFYRAINLNGSAVSIDGNAWEGSNAPNYSYSGYSFTDNNVSLNPATDASRTSMIRSSVYSTSLRVTLSAVPAGSYQVYLYVWEDNTSQTYSLQLEGQLVKQNHSSGAAGTWAKLGPYAATVSDGNLEVTTSGGNANLSGIEVWATNQATDPITANPGDATTDPTAFSGFYQLVARHSGKSLDVKGASTLNGANVEQWDYAGNSNQIWHIISTGDGYYKLLSKHSGKALDVADGSTQNGANIQQWDDNGTDAQRWKIESVGNGYYKLTAKCSGKVLDIRLSSQENGGNAIQWQYNGEDHQQWKLNQVQSNNTSASARLMEQASTVTVYPNPAPENVTLKFDWTQSEDVRIVLSNATGVEFYNKLKTTEQGENVVEIDASSLPVGVYFITIGSKYSDKLIINR